MTIIPHPYVKCSDRDVPDDIRFDVPGRYQGQIVEIAYGGYGRGEHDEGDLYRRVTDRSTPGQVTYYRLAGRT